MTRRRHRTLQIPRLRSVLAKRTRVVACVVIPIISAIPSLTRPLAAQDASSTHTTPMVGVSADAGITRVTFDGYSGSSLQTFTPRLWAVTPLGSAFRATTLVLGNVGRFASGSVVMGVFGYEALGTALPHGLRAQGDIEGATGRYRGTESAQYVRTSLRVGRLEDHTIGMWANASYANATRIGDVTGQTTGIGLGASATHDRAMLRLTLDRLHWSDTTSINAALSGTWMPFGAMNMTQVSLTSGWRFGDELYESSYFYERGRRYHLEVAGTIPLMRTLTLELAGGVVPADRERYQLGTRYTSIALRFSAGKVFGRRIAAGQLEGSPAALLRKMSYEVGPPDADGVRTLTLRLAEMSPPPRTAELMSDCTEWQPVAMTYVASGVWTVRLRLASGQHRIDIRTDGGPWQAPAGLPTIADEFGGSIGVLVIP